MKRALALAAVTALASLLVLVGRLERKHHADAQNSRIARVLDDIGPLDNPTLAAYRVLENFDCLLYRRGENPYALEVCVDKQGRAVEAIDRRGGEPWIGSVREEHGLAKHRVSYALLRRLLLKMDAPGVRSSG